MKKNLSKYLILIVALLLIFTVCACGSDGVGKDQNSDEIASTNSSTTESATSSENVISNETTSSEYFQYKYETKTLKFHSVAENDVTEDQSKTYIEIDGFGKYEIDSDGNVLINDYKVSDFNGKIVYFFKSAIGKDLVVISYDNDRKVYVNSYNPDGSKTDHNNNILKFKDVEGNEDYQKVDNVFFKDTYTAGFIVKINGKYYHNKLSSLNVQDPYLNIYEIDDCEKVYELGYRNPYSAVCYAKDNDESSVYFYAGSTEYTVHLPDNYTVDNIKQLSFGMNIVVVMDDKTVSTVEADRNAKEHTLVINEEVTTLNKSGNVKKIYVSNYNRVCDVLVELDDGNVYKIVNE